MLVINKVWNLMSFKTSMINIVWSPRSFRLFCRVWNLSSLRMVIANTVWSLRGLRILKLLRSGALGASRC